MYTWLQLRTPADLSRLSAHVSSEYDPAGVALRLSTALSPAVRAVLIEENYVDKDYRSTYYNFYSKKGRRYEANCVRLHFFDETVRFDQARLELRCLDRTGELSEHYFGYIVLRPTSIATIGRSVVSPDVRNGAGKFTLKSVHKVHVLGYKLTVEGFPSMDQHRDISVCAHAACWSILRHYSERYSSYREFLTNDITLMAQEFNPGGLVPSEGLDLGHAERIFQAAGSFPVLLDRENGDDESFYHQLMAYVDSGFPLYAAMNGREHAIVIIGYNWRPAPVRGVAELRFAWDEIEAVVVIDDNELPYLPIPTDNGTTYSAQDIDAFIVPLPEKIYYPADAVDEFAAGLYDIPSLPVLPPKEDTVIRYFITTGSAFREFVRKHSSEYDESLLQIIMSLPFAQFVWIIEYATRAQWDTSRVTARAVIDATASEHEEIPLWLIHNENDALVFDRQAIPIDCQVLELRDLGLTGFTRMSSNLRTTRTR